MTKTNLKILLLENIHSEAVKLFRSQGYQVRHFPTAFSQKDLMPALKDVSVLGIRSKTQITAKVLQAAPQLLAIGGFCVGTNQIDLAACTKKGIAVFNAPYSNTRSVAEFIMGEIIMLSRGVMEKSTALHQGAWTKTAEGSHEVRGKILGIVGYGNIGSQVSVLAEALGMKVCFYDVFEKLPLGNARKCRTLNELLKISDFVTLHVDGSPENTYLMGTKEFKQMKKGAIFLNASRGLVVDLKALVQALKTGYLKAAALDVFPQEPKNNQQKFRSVLRSLPQVILTPHIGGVTLEAQENIGKFASQKLIDYLQLGETSLSLNLPSIRMAKIKGEYRFTHIHQNRPGVLAQINGILGAHKINIEGQRLRTNEEVGYVMTDINKKLDSQVPEEIRKIPATIKFRVLNH